MKAGHVPTHRRLKAARNCSLLTDPNPNDPLVIEIALAHLKDRNKHDETAKE